MQKSIKYHDTQPEKTKSSKFRKKRRKKAFQSILKIIKLPSQRLLNRIGAFESTLSHE